MIGRGKMQFYPAYWGRRAARGRFSRLFFRLRTARKRADSAAISRARRGRCGPGPRWLTSATRRCSRSWFRASATAGIAALRRWAARLPQARPTDRSLHDRPVLAGRRSRDLGGLRSAAALLGRRLAPIATPVWVAAWLAVAGVSLIDDGAACTRCRASRCTEPRRCSSPVALCRPDHRSAYRPFRGRSTSR